MSPLISPRLKISREMAISDHGQHCEGKQWRNGAGNRYAVVDHLRQIRRPRLGCPHIESWPIRRTEPRRLRFHGKDDGQQAKPQGQRYAPPGAEAGRISVHNGSLSCGILAAVAGPGGSGMTVPGNHCSHEAPSSRRRFSAPIQKGRLNFRDCSVRRCATNAKLFRRTRRRKVSRSRLGLDRRANRSALKDLSAEEDYSKVALASFSGYGGALAGAGPGWFSWRGRARRHCLCAPNSNRDNRPGDHPGARTAPSWVVRMPNK